MNKFLAFFILVALCAAVSLVFLSGPDVAVESTPLANAHAEDSSRDDALHTANADLDSAPQMTRDDAIETHNTLAANQEAWASSTAELAYIKFRVVNDDGQPLPQCLVSLASEDERGFLGFSPEAEPIDYALNSQAEITLALEANNTTYYSVHHPNWQTKKFECQAPTAGEINDLGDITLNPAAVISGTVADKNGQPVKSASVRLVVISSGMWQSRDVIQIDSTDTAGAYLFSGLDADDYILEVMAPSYQKATKKIIINTLPAAKDADFALEGGELIQGRVLDSDGKPIAGAGIYQLFQRYRHEAEFHDDALTHSDINGKFSVVVGFEERMASIGAQHSSYTRQILDIENDRSLVSFILKPSLTLSGKLTHFDGLDFDSSSISLKEMPSYSGRKYAKRVAHSKIDNEGRFKLSDFPPGIYTFQANTNLGEITTDDLEILTSLENYEVSLPLTPRIEVTVIDASGAPVESAHLFMSEISQGSSWLDDSRFIECRSDTNGQCVFGGMPFEEYEISVSHEDFISHTETYSVWQDVQHLQVVLRRAANLHIKVTNPEGDAVRGISVKVKQDGEILGYGKTDDFGASSFSKLSDGDVNVYFDTDKGSNETWAVVMDEDTLQEEEEEGQLGHTAATLVAGDTTQLNWVVSGLASLEATITNNGQPAEGLSVTLVKVADDESNRRSIFGDYGDEANDKTNAKGVVVLDSFEIGEYTLRINLGQVSFPTEQKITLGAGYNTVRVDLELNSISGRLIDVSGAAVEEHRLSLIEENDNTFTSGWDGGSEEVTVFGYEGTTVATSDSAGYFEFVGVPDGDWVVVVHKKSFIPFESKPVQINGGSELNIGSIELQLGSRIYGFNARAGIYSQGIEWHRNSSVAIQEVSGDFYDRTSCDMENSEYSFDGLGPGTYQVSHGDWLSDEIVLGRGAEARVNIPLLDE